MATTVGVRSLKDSLSRYLRLVAAGERVIVVHRGRPIAVLSPVPEGVRAMTTEEHLASLAAHGLLCLGTDRRHSPPRRRPKVDLSGAVLANREERE